MPIAADSSHGVDTDSSLDGLLMRLAARLAVAPGDPAGRVEAILGELRAALEVDCVGLNLLSSDSDDAGRARHYHATLGPCPVRELLAAEPALVEELRRGQAVVYPPAEQPLPKTLAAAGVGTVLLLPLQAAERWVGTLGLAIHRAEARWPAAVMTSLQMFGCIVAGLLRAPSELDAGEAWIAMALEAGGIDVGMWNLVTGGTRATYHIAKAQSKQAPAHPIEPVHTYTDYLELVHPEHRGRLLSTIEAAIRAAVSGGDPSFQVEYILVQPNGNRHWVEFSGRVRRDASGVPTLVEGTLVDITKRKQIEQELNQQRQLLLRQTRLMEQTEQVAATGGWEWDLEADIVYWTPEMYRIYGFAPDSPLPPADELIRMATPESAERLRVAIQQALATGKAYDLQIEIVNRQGEPVPARATGRAEMENGRAIRLYGTVQDITQRTELERQLREARALYRSSPRPDTD